MRASIKLLAFSLGLILLFPSFATAQVASIGEIRTARDVKILRAGGVEVAAAVGTLLVEKDVLVTGASGTVGFVLNDNSVITLGPSTLFRLDEYVFAPRENRFGLLGQIFSGTMEYISGKISELSKGSVRFRTPYTTVAARGTRMLIRGDE